MTGHRVLAIGDSYMDAEVFVAAFSRRGIDADATNVAAAEATWPVDAVAEFEGDPAEIAQLARGYEIVACHAAPLTDQVFSRLPELRLVGCARGGPVNIDLDAARSRSVRVTTTPGKNADAVAELTLGFILMLGRNVPASLRDVDERRAGGLDLAESALEGARWFGRELPSLRIGLVGYGNVARQVAARAHALGATVSAYDPFVDPSTSGGTTIVGNLDELLASSDVVSIHARATPENRHLIGAREIALMPSGSMLVNTARKSLLSEVALLEALESGHLAGAALDVNEAGGAWRELVAQPNLILTPHLGGATLQTLARGADMLAEEVERYVAGEPLRWGG